MADKKEIIGRLDLPALIQELIPTSRPAGAEYSGLCPFHDDKSPSLNVNPTTGAFKCHACGEKGSIFDLFGKIHGLDFRGSIKALTARAGLEQGKSKQTVTGRYDYHDASGVLLYWKERVEPGQDGKTKDFYFYHGNKKNGRGTDAALYCLQDVAQASEIIICEGERKADVVKSWGLVGTSMDTGADSTLKPAMVAALTGKHIAILPDNDAPGRGYAAKIIKAMQGKAASIRVVDLPGLQEKGDIVDWIKTPGNDKARLMELLQAAPEIGSEERQPEPEVKNKSLFISPEEMFQEDLEPEYLIDELMECDTIGQTFGESGSGKSFVVISKSLAVSEGGTWNGYQCKKGVVLYLAGEGYKGIKRRVKAWMDHHGKTITDIRNFRLSRQKISFEATDIREVITEGKALERELGESIAYIVIDTLARHIIGDENKTPDMNAFIEAKDRLRIAFPGSVVESVHHTGLAGENKRRGRGSGAGKGAFDYEILCIDGTLEFTKMKESEKPQPIEFKLVPVVIGTRKNGKPITSCIVQFGERSASQKAATMSPLEKTALKALVTVCIAENNLESQQFAGSLEGWRQEFYRIRRIEDDTLTTGTLKKAFQRATGTGVSGGGLKEKCFVGFAENRGAIPLRDADQKHIFDSILIHGTRDIDGTTEGQCPVSGGRDTGHSPYKECPNVPSDIPVIPTFTEAQIEAATL
ncbi:MAG: AAA family ATPase [Desulfuromonadaceae bacterium]